MACNDCNKEPQLPTSQVPPDRSVRPIRGLGVGGIVYTGGGEAAIWEGLRRVLPDGYEIDTTGAIQIGLGPEEPSPLEGFEFDAEARVFRPLWQSCRSRAFSLRIQECGCIGILATCLDPSEDFFQPVSHRHCHKCDHRRPIAEGVRPKKRVPTPLPPLPAGHSSKPGTPGTA